VLNHPNISPWPHYEADEIEAAMQTLQTGKVNYWTGELGRKFESEYAKQVGKRYGIALTNGTVALELALRALGVKAGDEVIVASRSYVASASCVMLVGAIPVFADVDGSSGNMTPETIKPLITKKTKAIIPVHVGGWPCSMQEIMAVASMYDLMVIEDCAQAHGASVSGKPVGAWGHAAIFSFCQDKIMSTGGEGGMLVLDDEKAYKKAWAYKDIGRSYDAVHKKDHPEGFRWLTESVGSNARMTEFQAAIGLKQLKKLPKWSAQRGENAKEIASVLDCYDFINVPKFTESGGGKHAYYRIYAKVKESMVKNGMEGETLRNFIIKRLEQAGVPCFVGSCAEIYREKLFLSGAPKVRLPNAASFSDYGLCFLVHHTIKSDEIQLMKKRIAQVLDSLN